MLFGIWIIFLILAILSCLIPLVSGNRKSAFYGFAIVLGVLFVGTLLFLAGGK